MNRSAYAAAMFVVFFLYLLMTGSVDDYRDGGIENGRACICCAGENGCFGAYGA